MTIICHVIKNKQQRKIIKFINKFHNIRILNPYILYF